MIRNSTVYLKMKRTFPVFILALCLILRATTVFAKTETEDVNVLNLEISKDINSEIIKWNKSMGYIEVPVYLEGINFNILMDETELSSDNYSLNDSKSILYLHSSYLSNLDPGEYKIVIKNLDLEEILKAISLIIKEDQTISSSTANVSDESNSSESIETSNTTSSETEASSSKEEKSLEKVPDITNENNPIVTSKKIVSPVRPEFNKISESSEIKSEPKPNKSTVAKSLDANLNNENSKTSPSSEKSANAIASTGVGAISLPVSGLLFTLSSALIYKKHRDNRNKKTTNNYN